MCTYLVPVWAFWVRVTTCPCSSNCQQPQVHRKPATLLFSRQPNYKSSFSRGSSILKEYQVVQNSRLKARVRDPV